MNGDLLKLIQSIDSLFPIGSYTLSNGMETYVQKDIVTTEKELETHLHSYLYMLSFNDLAFAARAHDGADIEKLDALCGASKAPSELRNASMKQCIRFLKLHTALDDYPLLMHYKQLVDNGRSDGHYCIAMGLFIREIGVDLPTALELYCYSILSSITNHAVKLVPLRQLDGQRALLKAEREIPAAVKRAMAVEYNALGASGCGIDIRSMQHETLYSRLYIS
ncbi:MAG: urease accessory UreF family protein [Eubacteriales bacterium]|nr:urease accessory UreF family protein [Eubacteriales bacterium]